VITASFWSRLFHVERRSVHPIKFMCIVAGLAATLHCFSAHALDTGPSHAASFGGDHAQPSSGSGGADRLLAHWIEQARNTHPSIMAGRQGLLAAEQDLDASRRTGRPVVGFSLETGGTNGSSRNARHLRLDQSLWDGGRTKWQVEEAGKSVVVVQRQLAELQRSVELQVIEAWERALQAKGRQEVIERHLELLREHEAIMTRRVNADLSAAAELHLVEAQRLQVEIDSRKMQSALTLAALRLSQLTGQSISADTLGQAVALAPAQELRRRRGSLQRTADWSALAREQPQVLLQQALAQQAKARIATLRSSLKPEVYVRLSQGLYSGARPQAYVGLRYNFDTARPHEAQLRAAVNRVGVAEAERDSKVLESLERLMTLLDDTQELDERIDALMRSVTSAVQLHESYLRQFVIGRKTWVDVMSATRERMHQSYALHEAIASLDASLWRLELLAGLVDLGSSAVTDHDGSRRLLASGGQS